MYNVKLQIPHALREYDDLIEMMQNNPHRQSIIKKADMELRQQELDVAAQELKIKFEHLAVEKEQNKELNEIAQLFSVVSGQIEHFINSRAIFYDEFNTKVATLAFGIAQKVINNVVNVDENLILNIVTNAISESGNDDELIIKINPDDKTVLDKHWSKLKKEFFDKDLNLVIEPEIPKGSCIIDTESGDIDARIEKQLSVIEDTLFNYFMGNMNDSKELQ